MKSTCAILLLVGAAIAWPFVFGRFNPALITFGSLGPWWLAVFVLICAALGGVPPIAAALYRLLQSFSHPTRLFRWIATIGVALFSPLYLYSTAKAEHRQFFPYIHDEFSYVIQAHQLARDRLWMPGHPIGMFFDSFQLFTKPVYASAYFPGTAVVYMPGIWLHCQPWVTSLIVSGLVTALLYRITTELLDGLSGFLAVLLLLSDGLYRQMSILTLAQMPLLLYGLLAVYAWLRWRAKPRTDWAIGIGFFLGMAAITRPVDALCFAIPIIAAVMFRCFRKNSGNAMMGLFIGLFPLLILQLLLNHGITGHWLQTPFDQYADREYPSSSYGFHTYVPSALPRSELPQMQKLYDEYRPLIQQHQIGNVLKDLMRGRLRYVVSQTSPAPFPVLLLLLPICLMGFGFVRRKQRGPIAIMLIFLPLFLLLYAGYFLFLPTYALPTAPALIIAILCGAKAVSNCWPSHRRFTTVALTLFIAGSAIAALPNWSGGVCEDVFHADLLATVNQQLAQLPHRPAVVLFTYDPNRNVHEEPVYNADVAWPDDAPIIRAHDLGSMNKLIYDYYAQLQPQRFFYRYDERTRTLYPLGTAEQLSGVTP